MEALVQWLFGIIGAVGSLFASLVSPAPPAPTQEPPSPKVEERREAPTPPPTSLPASRPQVRALPLVPAEETSPAHGTREPSSTPSPSLPAKPKSSSTQPSAPQTPPTAQPNPQPRAPSSPSSPPSGGLPPLPPPPPPPSSETSNSSTGSTSYSWSELNKLARSSLVNLRCERRRETQRGIVVSRFSGSGVFIDPRGVILTNAHIAYPLALASGESSETARCEARSGEPARPLGEVSLLFLPEAWAKENAAITTAREDYISTGEHDYALLRLSSLAPGAEAASRTAAPWDGKVPQKGEEVLLAAYPAEFFSSEIIERSLYPLTTIARVAERYAFPSHPTVPAVLELPGVVLAQKGASGGGVFRANGALAGIITTGGIEADTTEQRVLYALTLRAIDLSLRESVGMGLARFLSGNLDDREAWFRAALLPRVRRALEQ